MREAKRDYETLLGGFGYHALPSTNLPTLLRQLRELWHYATTSVRLSFRFGRYDAIVAYAPFRTAWAGVVASIITRTPLVVQMVVNPVASFQSDDFLLTRIKRRLARISLSALLRFTDHLHFLYAAQSELCGTTRQPPSSVFANFTAVSQVPRRNVDEGFILFVGFPWRLKGVDILIQAFSSISAQFPDVSLRIVGHCPDRSPYERLAGGNPRIEFHRAMSGDETMDWLSRCKFLVLPSRTEAMGRVMLEAWAAGKPVIGSAVDGIPHFVRDGVDGLLFPSEDVEALANSMVTLLKNPQLAREMGERGQEKVEQSMTESHYASAFAAMIETVRRQGRRE